MNHSRKPRPAGVAPARPREVAIVGTGLIGQAWALSFARGRCNVRLWDGEAQALARARTLIEELAIDLEAGGLIDDAGTVLARIRSCPDLREALDGIDHAQENLPEQVSLKQEIFLRMDRIAPKEAVLASSTSSLPSSAFTEHVPGRARCLVAHPVNPPYLIPVVEVCGAPWTDARSTQACLDLMRSIGQEPVHVRRELEGFVLNRLQGALLREAFRLVEQGCVDVDGLDAVVRDGLGLRWSFMGPFETIDLNAPGGIADYCARYGGLYQSIAQGQTSTAAWSPELVETVHAARRSLLPADALAQRRTWRDRRLMDLARQRLAARAASGQGTLP